MSGGSQPGTSVSCCSRASNVANFCIFFRSSDLILIIRYSPLRMVRSRPGGESINGNIGVSCYSGVLVAKLIRMAANHDHTIDGTTPDCWRVSVGGKHRRNDWYAGSSKRGRMITVEALRVLILPVDLHQDGDTSQPVQERPASGAVASKPIPILGIIMAFIKHEVDESTVCEWGCSTRRAP